MRALDELLQRLDELTALLHERVSAMRQMRECVRRTDLEGLAAVLQTEAQCAGQTAAGEQMLHESRERLAAALAVPLAEATVSRLAQALDGQDAIGLNDRRERLMLVVRQLRDESAATASVVRFAFEFNRKLLAAIVGNDGSTQTYSAAGAVEMNCRGSTIRHSA